MREENIIHPPTYHQTCWLVGQYMSLNKTTSEKLASMKGSKETGNDHAHPVSQVVWNDPKKTGWFDYPRRTIKPGPIPW